MLAPITNWNALRRALQRERLEVYYCEDCKHVWLASAKNPPLRCSQRDCRAWATSPLRDGQVGRPPEEAR
jgi:Zn-finger nucleic acid-binding protein